jgi:flavin reductase (DIM6/NTAB) family NADH-FMN oxidoreductase RutF
LTTVLDGGFRAATLTGWLLVSVDPVQVAVSIEVESQMESWLRQSGVFGLSVLPWSQQFLADRFAGRAPLASRTFAGIDHFTSATGAPLLTHSVGWVDCRITDETETGDHVLFFGEALAVGRGADEAAEPLMYYFNQYRHFR